MKDCRRCGEPKPLSDFREKHTKGRYYRSSWCRACDVAYTRAWRGRHPGYHAAKSAGYRAMAVARLIPLVLLAGCSTLGEVRTLVDEDRLARTAITAEAAAMKLKPLIVANTDALEDYKADNQDTTGRAIERIAHESLDRDEAIKGSFARESALTASVRAELRRDGERRDHALGLALTVHKAENEGSRRSMLADIKIAQSTATTAGVTAGANRERVRAIEKRVEAEDADDASDHQRTLDVLKAALVARDSQYEKDRKADKAWQRGVPADMQDKLLGIAGKVGGAVLLIGAAWAWFKKRA